MVLIALRFAKRDRQAAIKAQMSSPNFVQLPEVDGPAMAKFLQEMAKEIPIRFTAQQICSFTNNYSKILGSGGYGIVYKGQFPNGADIAVKVLKRNSDSNKVVEDQFMSEVSTMSRTRHVNLVRLYGFFHDQLMSALVYEFLENGSLDKYLFNEMHQLEWQTLCDIAIGTAKGIAYLHEECQQRIIHYDIKPGNILLDSKFSPKVADFGLAKLCNKDSTHITMTGYRGTPGYSAPELTLMNQPITHKCDVYSYGMLLFEIIGRRRNAGHMSSSDSLNWFPKQVWDNFEKGELGKLTSTCGIEEKNREKAERMSMVALWCVQDSPDARPPMSAVVKMLEGGVDIVLPPKPFQYLYSMAINAQPEFTESSSDSTSGGSNSCWYKETTPIMRKYEIQIASS
ncbi:hypothetical protein L6164_037501 [Bauhinia variegata]|uniref:Uncharacterized protein n=1 Tax=Bauhinia variegata TaxID=167791 RepID=A0ACB9KKF9_BAUVA|nr:hypothetical protein L6164_037501 [Bauhinia variegata]